MRIQYVGYLRWREKEISKNVDGKMEIYFFTYVTLWLYEYFCLFNDVYVFWPTVTRVFPFDSIVQKK